MFGTVLTHEVKRIARSVDAVYGDSDQQRYVLGSCTPSSKKLNQLQLLDANLSVLQTYAHANPVQHLAMCPLPKKAHHVLTTFVSVPSIHLPRRCIAIGFARTRDDRFGHPSLNATSISTWTLADGGSGKEVAKLGLGEGHNQLNAIAWDPHHRQQVSATVDESIVTWDVRSGKYVAFHRPVHVILGRIAHKVHQAHFQCTRDIDYNPNKPYYMASGGDDGLVKVWCVKYNRFHDQLVLSSSSDSSVNLWRVSSISSAPLLDESTDAGGIDIGDAKISTHDGDHEDSVYAVAWGSQDSWVYVSLSYDGRVVLNTVPSTEKYRILL
ncbi:hypothetical protein DYB37_008693 [Aphanomyces astaci]|uniref:EIPR1-like beta-propeller domain-containing protein n=1 Tax=Aphanomyces astaci TaxID=112090 RepID=A0A3R7AMK8_APHAT|nr:hypothetical protein DYB35_002616 [Aphanomyces astaci]RHZ10578.1 hypothetical protein DYB37_008693 [Aphanomyces astaci]